MLNSCYNNRKICGNAWKRVRTLLKNFSDQNSTNSSYRIAAQKLANELGTPDISILSTIIEVVASFEYQLRKL